jgi:hypothetical protein
MKKIKQVDLELQKQKDEKEKIDRLQRERIEKLQKEKAALAAAEKKWLDSLETSGAYKIPLTSTLSSEDFFKDYYDQYNGKIIP